MNPLSVTESWIANELLMDATLQGIVGNKIYYGAAEDEAGSLFVVYNLVSGQPLYNLGTKREHSWSHYDIVVWQSGTDTRKMKEAADRIDEMFSVFRAREFTRGSQTFQFYSQTSRLISLKNHSEPPFKWRGMGAEYKISATKK